jgi:putative ABC transport system permease protein
MLKTLGRTMGTVLQDLRFGLRTLFNSPSFAVAAVLTLALGIACSLTMFGVVEWVISDTAPVLDPGRLVTVRTVIRQTGFDRSLVSIPDFLDWRIRARAFEELGAFAGTEKLLTDAGEPQWIATEMVSANFFHLLGIAPKLGRGFGPNEENSGAPHVAVISERLWRGQFGGDPTVLGHTLRLDGLPYTVIGIMPENFWYPSRGIDAWIPLTMDPKAGRGSRTVVVVGRLRRGITVLQAQADLDDVARSLELEFPSTNRGISARVVSVESEQLKRVGLALTFGLGPALLVLIVGCANVTNLLLARGFLRQTEFATRAALGATRGRIVRQLLTENLPVVLAGAALGTVGAYVGIEALRTAFRSVNPHATEELHLDPGVLALGLIVAVWVPLLFGLIPALRVSRANLNDALRHAGTPTGVSIGLKRLPLVVVEIAFAMLLLVVTALFGRSFLNLERTAVPDIDPRNLVIMTITPIPHAPDLNQLLNALAAIPGITATGVASDFPILADSRKMQPLWVENDGRSTEASAIRLSADAGLIGALGLRILQGQPGSEHTLTGAIVSESFARRYGGNVLGLRVRTADSYWVTVTGVVSDWLRDPKTGTRIPTAYFPLSRTDIPVQVILRANDGRKVIPAVKRAIRAWNQAKPIEDCETVYQSMHAEIAGSELIVNLIGLFGFLVLLLASTGIYGIMSYSITRRTREMGIRLALGATRARIFALVLREAALLATVGLLVGWFLGVGAAFVIAHELIGVAPQDPLTALVCSLVILTTGLLASYLPARHAANVEPMAAIRFE